MKSERGGVPAVGVCLTTTGAVIAVVRPDPLRLIAVADVSGPSDMWRPGEQWRPGGSAAAPPPAAWLVLARARRRLGLPRWCAASVVCGPSLRDGYWNVAGVLARSAELLARAGLVQAAVAQPGQLGGLRAVDLAIDARLAAAAAGEEPGLAARAALAMLRLRTGDMAQDGPARDATHDGPVGDVTQDGRIGAAAPGFDRREWTGVDTWPTGWAVQRIGDVAEPAAVAATNAR